MDDVRALLPQNKMDTERAEALVALGYPAVAPVLQELVVWMQDTNWPVTDVILPFLVTIGLPLVPYIRKVFSTDDSPWIDNVLLYLVKTSPAIFNELQAEVLQLSLILPSDEDQEAIQETAQEVLDYYGVDSQNSALEVPGYSSTQSP